MGDIDAWTQNALHRWVYFKPHLCDMQSIEWAPCPVMPTTYPVIVRPTMNLCGMGAGVQIVHSAAEYTDACVHGYFWTPVLRGAHTSHDFTVECGRFVSETVFRGQSMEGFPGAFAFWELLAYRRQPERTPVMVQLEERLQGYTGKLNVECIGGHIIEAHLRAGDETIADEFAADQQPLFLVPVWHDPLDGEAPAVDTVALEQQQGVLAVLDDDTDISGPGCGLQRCALVVTRQLPDDMAIDAVTLDRAGLGCLIVRGEMSTCQPCCPCPSPV